LKRLVLELLIFVGAGAIRSLPERGGIALKTARPIAMAHIL
jgi:hypothetical protein